jgi:hypothetical protein
MKHSKVLEDVLQAAIGAKTHFDVWWAQVSEGRLVHPESFRRHSDFFAASENAHYTAFFIQFAQMFDPRKDVSSIPTYLRLIKNRTDNQRFTALSAEYELLASRAEPLLQIRHSLIAHVSAALTETDVFGPLGISWFEIRSRIYESTAFVGRLAGASQPGEVGIPRDGRLNEATLKLLKALVPHGAGDA